MVTARASGGRVEDVSQRTETTKTYANADGSWTSEVAAEPEQVQAEQGQWHPIDTTLEERGGVLAPRYAASDLELSDGGDNTFAAVSEDARDLQWRWPTTLPAPVVEGSTATYHDVVPNGDLVVTATATGFEHSLVLSQAPTEPLEITTPIVTDGAHLVDSPEGGVAVKTGSGETVVSSPGPLMWDSSTDNEGEPENVSLVETSVGHDAAGTPTMTLAPDSEFLADPATVYPVTVDPSFTVGTYADTWVQNAGYTTSQVSSDELRAGTYDSGTHKARSFLKFDVAKVVGTHVLSADMVLRNFSSNSCTASAIRAEPINESWAIADLTWTNQPAVDATRYDDYSPAKGYNSTCVGGDATWDVTSIAQGWADGAVLKQGIRLKAVNEASNASWRLYRSGNYGAPTVPHINITYNTVPGAPTAPTTTPVGSYAPPGQTISSLFTSALRPTFSATGTDVEGGKISNEFKVYNTIGGPEVASCTGTSVSNGAKSTCTLTADLTNGSTYYVRARTNDGTDQGPFSDYTSFTVASGTPAAPTVSCPGYADGSWTTTPPGTGLNCTITAASASPSAAGKIRYSIDGSPTIRQVLITSSSDPAVAKITTVKVPATEGGHSITAWSVSRAGILSSATDYNFGYGQVGITTPDGGDLPVTTGNLAISAAGPPVTGGATVPATHLRWRLAASGQNATSGWTDSPGPDLTTTSTAEGVSVTGTWDTMTADHDTFTNTDLDDRVPTLLDVQVCVDYTAGTQCSWAATQRQVMRVPHAFGEGFPTADVPGGQVALWTGEFNTDATDATLPTGTGSLSISRSASSYDGMPTSPAAKVFGDGWTANLDGPEAGLADLQLIDSTLRDGTITAIDSEGNVSVFAPKTGQARRTTDDLPQTDWVPLDRDTVDAGITAKTSGAGSLSLFTLTELDGTSTTFKVTAPPNKTTAAVFAPSAVSEPGALQTQYDYDQTTKRLTRILGPVPAGKNCPPTGTQDIGCRSLTIDYATATTATVFAAGDFKDQVKSIWINVGTSAPVKVATYLYDSSGRLVSVTDPRNSLTTGYTYQTVTNGQDRITSITPPGLKPISYEYAGADNRLARVKRDRPAGDPAGGTATLATILYNVPTHGAAGLPDLTAGAVGVWGQTTAPTYGTAVFGPDLPEATLDPTQVPSGDWASADLSYTDARGYEVNTASYGAGAWQYTDTEYDQQGNPVRELDEGDIDAVRSGDIQPSDAGTLTTYNDQHTNTAGAVTLPAGSVVTDTYDTARYAVLGDGSRAWVRPHTHTTYDEGAPNAGIDAATGQEWALPTTETTDAVDPATQAVRDTLAVTKTAYGDAVPGDANAGWKLGLEGSTTQVMTGGTPDVVSRSRYDALGRVTEQRQPKSTGTDAGTRQTIYYTAGANPVTACASKPAWDGALCQTKYAAAPSSGPALPTTTITGYTDLLAPTTVTEAANGALRTTTTGYNTDGTVATTTTTASGLGASQPVPALTYTYDPATGLPTITTSTGTGAADPVSTGYDGWGRQTSYSAAAGETTSTNYDTAGRVKTITDPKGTTTYTYDGTDALSHTEHRGLPTKVSISNPGGPAVDVTGGYDAAGNLIEQGLPGGITQRSSYDTAGDQTGLTYSGLSNGDQVWVGWSQDHDATGRVRHEWTPSGAVLSGDTTGSSGSGYTRDYTYDRASRLVHVTDRTATPGAGAVDPNNPGSSAATSCLQRDYGFDANGNRTSLTRTPAASDGSCQGTNPTGVSTKDWAYDTADRITGGYTYDALGRATTLPATDTPIAANGGTPTALTIGYYHTDAARTITQNATTTTFSLDTSGRRTTSVTGPESGGTPTNTTVRHYTDNSDNPAWVTSTSGATTVTERYAEALDGDLGFTIDSAGTVQLPLVNMHGDAVSQLTVPANGDAAGIDSWHDNDEYGNSLDPSTIGTTPSNTTGSATGLGYGWLGGNQRATDGSGLVLMGARLYNAMTGQFSSADPVFGGNDTAYGYPQDPTNLVDLDGRESTLHKIARQTRSAAICYSFGSFECGQALAISKIVKKMFNKEKAKGNFVRHFVWQVALTIVVGASMTRSVLRSHEWGLRHDGDKSKARDSRRDSYNNAVVRVHTATHLRRMSRLFYSGSYRALGREGRRLYRRGLGAHVSY